jgi:hypothetical protein
MLCLWQFDLGTNIIPLSYVCVGLPFALVQGQYQHVWVEMAIPEPNFKEQCLLPSYNTVWNNVE